MYRTLFALAVLFSFSSVANAQSYYEHKKEEVKSYEAPTVVREPVPLVQEEEQDVVVQVPTPVYVQPQVRVRRVRPVYVPAPTYNGSYLYRRERYGLFGKPRRLEEVRFNYPY